MLKAHKEGYYGDAIACQLFTILDKRLLCGDFICICVMDTYAYQQKGEYCNSRRLKYMLQG